ncbi:MAG: hypothetical protein IKG47_05655 [Oscillospiraceae bacterium]|nr:hypothetical protein [Oscillospiraceae bacterium]
MAEQSLMYKGKPLARKGNDIYYGDPSAAYVVYLQVLTTEKKNNIDVANRVQVMLLSTDSSLGLKDRIVRVSEKNSLYSALDIGFVWLERALKG